MRWCCNKWNQAESWALQRPEHQVQTRLAIKLHFLQRRLVGTGRQSRRHKVGGILIELIGLRAPLLCVSRLQHRDLKPAPVSILRNKRKRTLLLYWDFSPTDVFNHLEISFIPSTGLSHHLPKSHSSHQHIRSSTLLLLKAFDLSYSHPRGRDFALGERERPVKTGGRRKPSPLFHQRFISAR